MGALLGFIPLLGPIIQGISSIFTGYFSEKTAVVQAGAQIAITETQATTQIIHDTQDDILLRILRDATILPVVIWSMAIGWDTLISGRDHAGNLYHAWAADWIWHVPDYPPSVTYLPYMVLVFLFGNIGLNMWKRK